jgi:transcriptional regulator with XRE-family HTH domain
MGSLDPLYVQIGKQIRDRRRKKGITQERLAELASLTRTSITNIEKGRQKLPIHTLYALANALGAEATELLPDLRKSKDDVLERKVLKDLSKKEVKWVEAVMKGGATYENKEENNS